MLGLRLQHRVRLGIATRLSFACGECFHVLAHSSIKPTTSTFLETAYELSPTSLALADQHPNVVRRGGKAGREAEYTYTFGMC